MVVTTSARCSASSSSRSRRRARVNTKSPNEPSTADREQRALTVCSGRLGAFDLRLVDAHAVVRFTQRVRQREDLRLLFVDLREQLLDATFVAAQFLQQLLVAGALEIDLRFQLGNLIDTQTAAMAVEREGVQPGRLTRPSNLTAMRLLSDRAYASASSIFALHSRSCWSRARLEASASAVFSRS